MSNFNQIIFTPAEFARLARIDRNMIPLIEESGLLSTIRQKVGNVDRKMVTLEGAQNYFRAVRQLVESGQIGRRGDQSESAPQATEPTPAAEGQAPQMGDGAEAAGAPMAVESLRREMTAHDAVVAAATAYKFGTPKHKLQMFYNVKGGTGKSTLTAQFVMRAAMMGLRVLAVDLDGQGHLTVNLDVLEGHELPTVYDVLINDLPIEQAIISVAPGLDLLPANLGLCNIEIPLNQKPRREYRLSEALEKVAPHYDLIVADTNPAASILNSSMLVAAQSVNVVCATNPLSFHGMSLVMATIDEMKREFRRQLDVKIIPNMYDAREVISQEVLGELQGQFAENCTRTVVNRSADLNEATKRRSTVWEVSSKGQAAQDIDALAEELIFG
ncbi:MAG TPA: AAA family ATPase [Bdellovibrionota bacterium]|jgi:chromosome partitioning protein|nr:AAA family ATPase [Bdellovibrionota bacterium]